MKKRQLTGYDLDGVIAPKRENFLLSLIWAIAPRIGSFLAHYKLPPPLRIPDKNDIIITGRAGQEYEETLRWLKQHGINNTLYMNSVSKQPNRERSGHWKIMHINDLGVTKYYEDNLQLVKLLSKKTDAKIIYITKTS